MSTTGARSSSFHTRTQNGMYVWGCGISHTPIFVTIP